MVVEKRGQRTKSGPRVNRATGGCERGWPGKRRRRVSRRIEREGETGRRDREKERRVNGRKKEGRGKERVRERKREREKNERTRRAPYRHPIPLGYCFLMWPGGLRRSTHRMVLFVVTKITGCGLQRGRGNVTYRAAERRTVDRYRRQSGSDERHEFCLPSSSLPLSLSLAHSTFLYPFDLFSLFVTQLMPFRRERIGRTDFLSRENRCW